MELPAPSGLVAGFARANIHQRREWAVDVNAMRPTDSWVRFWAVLPLAIPVAGHTERATIDVPVGPAARKSPDGGRRTCLVVTPSGRSLGCVYVGLMIG